MIKVIQIGTDNVVGVNLHTKESGIGEYLNNAVGGWFDCVHNSDLEIVGYVHDEGLLLGLDINPIATALFGQVLVGTCVIVGALDANGVYDGDSHSVPEKALERIAGLYPPFKMWLDHKHDLVTTEAE
jgi:hypothetical protein